MLIGLGAPVLILMALALLTTRLVEKVAPETLAGLVILGLVSALLLWPLSAGVFAALYVFRGVETAALLGTAGGLHHFLTLGAKAALVWAPIVLLVVTTAPRRWKTNTW